MFAKKSLVTFAKGIAAVLIAAGVAAGAALVYRVLNAAGWGMILRALGHPLPLLAGVRLWLIAETMRPSARSLSAS